MTVDNAHFQVLLGDTLTPPSSAHHLLVAFRFGDMARSEEHPAVVDTHLDAIGRGCLYESWWIADTVSYRQHGDIRIAECADYAVLIQENEEQASDDLVSLTHTAYLDLHDALRSTAHLRLAKIWNYLGAINEGDGDEERYRQFSVGRAAAFSESGLADNAAPAGTGIGTKHDLGLTIIALASRHPLRLAENPRQISAFRYPRQYGPSSPKFARGGSVSGDGHALHLLSGTAAIVGHESLHPYDVDLQVDETLRNISALGESLSVLDGNSVFRVYVRDPHDVSSVASKIKSHFDVGDDQVVFLHGHICRRELLIEIDGVGVQ